VPWSGAPDCPVCHRTVSGAPPDSVRCTWEPNSELATFGNSGSRSAIIHRTVLCSTGLSGVPAEQRLHNANDHLQRAVNALQCAQKSEQSQKAHRTVNSDCLVHQRTVRWSSCQKLQQSEPNGRVTWLAHRTMSGAPCDNSLHQRLLWWLGYKYPQPPTIHCIQVFSLHTSYKSYSIQYKTQTRDQILSQVQRSFQSNSD
jgi:hypothetical protein